MPEYWEQCRICGAEWPIGTKAECAHYRDAMHRRQRLNDREQDILVFDKITGAPRLAHELAAEIFAKAITAVTEVTPPPPPAPEPPPVSLPATHRVDTSRLEIVIVGHTRHACLQDAVKMWAATTPGYRSMVIIGNHPTTFDQLTTLPERVTKVSSGRIPSHGGCLSESWNLGLMWTFIQHNDTEWVVLSQDDVKITNGWLEIVQSRAADVYNAPAGDMVMLMHRRAFQKVGWFDEHIRTIGGQDLDWIARAVITLGEDRVVSEDHHGWRYNPIGLEAVWESALGKATPGSSYLSGGDVDLKLKAHLQSKWGISTEALRAALVSHSIPTPQHGEYDWYPWCAR